MQSLRWVYLFLAAFFLSGCASQLQHTYEGDVHLRVLEINMEPLELHNNGVSGDFAKITKIQKVFQSLEGAFNEEQSRILHEQMNEVAQVLVKGIGEASGVPLVASEAVDIALRYDNYGQLIGVTYEYPREDGAYMNLYGNIYYSVSDSNTLGVPAVNVSELRVRPKLQLQIDGYTADKKLFWRTSPTYDSNVRYRFGNKFILGLSTTKMEDGEIFLLPLAKGISSELLKKKEKGEL